jgi:hypothetical protein
MESVAISVPIQQDRVEAVIAHVEHLVSTLEHPDHGHRKSYMQEHGLNHVRFYHQTYPAHTLIIYLEGPELTKALGKMAADHQFPKEWEKVIEEATGGDAAGYRSMPSHMIMDYHHEEGHRHRNPRAHLPKT